MIFKKIDAMMEFKNEQQRERGFDTRLKSQLTGPEIEEVLTMEIKTYRRIVSERKEWLARPRNQLKSHWGIIRSDTKMIEAKIEELRDDLRVLRDKMV